MLTTEKVWFLKLVCDYHALPNDAMYYIMHFCIPFVLGERERFKINTIYDRVFDGKKLKKLEDGMKDAFVTDVVSLLNDHSIILDTRINDDRIEKFVRMLEKVRSIKGIPCDRAIYVLKKGLIVDVVEAFDLFFYFGTYNTNCPEETKPFLHRVAKRCNTIFAGDLIRKFVYSGLEIGISDECLVQLLNESMRRGVNMYTYLKQDAYMSENQRHNFTLFQQTRMNPF